MTTIATRVPTCQRCERPSPDAYGCPGCWAELMPDIAMLGWLDAQLTITRTRQGRLDTGRRTGGETALGYGSGAALAQDALRSSITTWARDLDPGGQHATISACAVVLLEERAVRHHPAFVDLARDVERYRDWALLRINPEETLPTYGLCGAELEDGDHCEAYLYGDRAASWVRCRACRTQHETRERREWMRRRMEVLYFRAATLARLLPVLIDRPVSADHIRAWARAGKPIDTGEDDAGYSTYRCGDVITVALAAPQRERKPESSAGRA